MGAVRIGLAALIAVHRDEQTTTGTDRRGGEEVGIPAGSTDVVDKLVVARALAAERDGHLEQALVMLLQLLDPDSTLVFSGLRPRRMPVADRCG